MPSFKTRDSRTLEYASLGSGPPLVCHPGGPGFSGAYMRDLGGLARVRTLIVPDPRGTGRSDAPERASAYALDDYVADLAELQEHLELDRISLLGHSHGSFVALLYAAKYPDRVDRLILAAVGARIREEQLQAMHEAMQRHSHEPWFDDASAALQQEENGAFSDDAEFGQLFARELSFYFADYGEKEQEFVRQLVSQQVHAAALRYFNDHEFLAFDLRPALPDVTADTLVVAGERDFILGPQACWEVADGIPNARLEVLHDVGHLPWVERPERFASTVATFLSE